MNYKIMILIGMLVIAFNSYAQENVFAHENTQEFDEIKYQIPEDIDKELEELRKKRAIEEEVPGPVGVPAPHVDPDETPSQGQSISEAGGGVTAAEQEKTAQEAEKAINN